MAIQQADKLLKKHKDLHCAKVSVIVARRPPVGVARRLGVSFLNPLEHLGLFKFMKYHVCQKTCTYPLGEVPLMTGV